MNPGGKWGHGQLGSGNGNKVFLITPFHQIAFHLLYSSGQFLILFHQTLNFNYCLT